MMMANDDGGMVADADAINEKMLTETRMQGT